VLKTERNWIDKKRKFMPQDRYAEDRNSYERPGIFGFHRGERSGERDVDYERKPRVEELEEINRKAYEYPKDFRHHGFGAMYESGKEYRPRYENYQDIDRPGRYVDFERRGPKYIPRRYDEYDSESRRQRGRRSRSNSRDRFANEFISPLRRRSISSDREISRSPPRSRSFHRIPEENMDRVWRPAEENYENKVFREKEPTTRPKPKKRAVRKRKVSTTKIGGSKSRSRSIERKIVKKRHEPKGTGKYWLRSLGRVKKHYNTFQILE